MSFVAVAIYSVVAWLVDTLLLWVALRLTAKLSGEGEFPLGFWEGFVKLLPITGIMALVGLLAQTFLGGYSAVVMLIAWVIVLRFVLDLEWGEIIILAMVLSAIRTVVAFFVLMTMASSLMASNPTPTP
jgi:hypothetical protein